MLNSLLLAGPILRRSEQYRVCVWLATGKSVEVSADVYVSNDNSQPETGKTITKEDLKCIGTCPAKGPLAETVQLGDNLFITLLSIKPSDKLFPLDTLLFYDVVINGDDLGALGLVDGDKSIVYPGMPLPSFFLPGKISNLIHGSCRKPHGPGTDTLPKADDFVSKTVNNLKERPAVLFLTGDQIYADDVAGPIIKHITEYGEALTGWQEELPVLGNPKKIGLYERMSALEKANSGFSSGASGNHLLTFGEYAAMYLSVWSGENRPDDSLNADPQLSEKLSEKYKEESKSIKEFQETVVKARRLLANIPTYMMFDDHEVTDDWNLHRKWFNDVSESECGRRIVANALAAYWAFQGWGNSPEAFSPRFINTISEHLLDKGTDVKKAKRFDQRLWNFHRWGYSLPTNPPVIALDSRTQREFDSYTGPAKLIDRYGLEWIRNAWVDIGEPREHGLIIIAATPIYGYEPIEWIQKIATSIGFSPTSMDRESWIANRDGFGALMRLLNREIRPKTCIILSGDVHFAFCNLAEFHSDGQTLYVKQLTSSAIKNFPKKRKHLKWLSTLTDRTEHRTGWKPDTPLYKRLSKPVLELFTRWGMKKSISKQDAFWTDKVSGIAPDGKPNLLYTSNNIGLVNLEKDGTVKHKLLTESEEVITYRL